ncbi:Aste57867_12935 [Aphanomyces stellatus]|uniref:Aste57867_12935 protein n=1 Tax=Aphanomyces stellatus TaxID=120398 RepID=A0A485KWW0_9STRA|nr:hypothetical protein As57867_012887 [Aphanomyces stellatus]VFT89781.1 Aste57867_12935 [Aphanomyces stellatus]
MISSSHVAKANHEKHFDDDAATASEQRNVSDQLRFCALVLSVAAFFLFTYLDLCPQESVTVLALGTLMLAWTGPLTSLAGTQAPSANGKFKLWQPFEGGFHFVSMQAVGWSLMGLLMAVCSVYLANFQTLMRFEGQFLLIGIVGFITQMLLNVSLDYFVPDAPVPLESFPSNSTKALVAILLSVTGCLFFVAFDWLLPSPVLLVLGAVQFSVAAAVLHVGVGCCDVPGYTLWQPFVGGNVFMLLQYLGWKFLACTLVSTVLLSSADFYAGIASCMGIIGFISQMLLLRSISFFHVDDDTVSRPAVPHHRLPEETYICAIVLIMTDVYTALLYYDMLSISPTNLRLLCILCLFLLGCGSPLAHIGGHRAVPGYRLWQPFVGDSKFVFIQSVGWTWYGVFVGVALLGLLNDTEFLVQLLPLATLLGTAACAAIGFSMPFFQPCSDTAFTATRAAPPPADLLLSLFLSSSAVVLHLVVDAFALLGLLASLCIALALLLSALAMAVTHAAGARKYQSYHLYQPFVGGNAFVLRQALGWTFFAIFALFDCICIATVRDADATSPPQGFVLSVGLVVFIPHWILASALPLFQEHMAVAEIVTPVKMAPFRLNVPILANLSLVLGSLALFTTAELCRSWRPLSELFFVFGTVGAVTALVCTHCVCGPHVHSHYRLFQPFRGGLRFVVLQGAGWSLGSVAWVAACSAIYWPAYFFQIDCLVLAIGSMFMVSHVLLLVALYCFDNDPLSSTATARVAKPNFVLAMMVGVVSCCVFALVDIVLMRFGAAAMVPAFPTTACAIAALLVSIPVVFYMQGRVVLRVLGVTLWSLTVVLGAIFTYNIWREETLYLPYREPRNSVFGGVLTGSLGLVAHLVLLAAVASDADSSVGHRFRWQHQCTHVVAPVAATCALLFVLCHGTASLDRLARVLQPTQVLVAVCSLCLYLAAGTIFRLVQPTLAPPPSDRPLSRLAEPLVRHIASFLDPTDMAALAASSKHHHALISPSVWHAMFLARLRVPPRPTPALPRVKASTLFSHTWSLSLERSLLASLVSSDLGLARPLVSAAAPATTASPAALEWKHIACVVARGGAFFQCEICLAFAVFTGAQRAWETRHACDEHMLSTWIASPCACRHPVTHTPRMAHRCCVERTRRPICRLHTDLQPVLRAPVSLCEFFFASIWTRPFLWAAAQYAAVFAALAPLVSPLFFVWLVGMTLLSAVVQSREFDRAVQLIWNDADAFPLYVRLYYTMALSCVLLLVAPLWTAPSALLQLGFALNATWFVGVATLVGVLFWKAQAPVLTFAPAAACWHDQEPPPPLGARCALCRLHVCRTTPPPPATP